MKIIIPKKKKGKTGEVNRKRNRNIIYLNPNIVIKLNINELYIAIKLQKLSDQINN